MRPSRSGLWLTAAFCLYCATDACGAGEIVVPPAHANVVNNLCPACPAWTTIVDYSKLESALFTLEDERKTPVKTAADWAKKREQIRQRILANLGPFPKKVPLVPMQFQEDEYQGVIRRKVSYQVEEGERVSAWLLIPKGCDLKQKHPAILCPHQTIPVGKDEPIGLGGMPHLNYALKLTRDRGYITLTPDYLTAGERVSSKQGPFYTDTFYQRHPEWSMFGKNLWDSMRAVDYLQSLAFIDPDKIGCTGHSLGGNNTTWIAAFDDRIKVAVDSCSGLQLFQANWKYALEYSRTGWYIYCPQLRPYFLKEQTPFDMHELFALIAPRPYLQTGAFNDDCNPNPLDTVLASKLVRKVYKLLGVEDNFNLFMHHGTHGYPDVALKMGVALFETTFK
ncbi:MAG: alpha/beta hydrolase family protein [Armatimonadota bacterium]